MLRRLFAPEHLLNWMLVFVPIAAWLHYAHGNETWVFVASALAIVPLAGLMGRATEELAVRAGPGIGGLMNASFGNAAELIIALMALRSGQVEIVQASITGSIIGNLLFVFGLAVLVGGLRRDRQTFNRTAASVGASVLFLGTVGLLVPTLVARTAGAGSLADDRLVRLSRVIAGILLIVYLLKLLFSLRTHKHLYNEAADAEAEHEPKWGPRTSAAVLLVATGFTAWTAEFLVGAAEHAAGALGLSHVFVGVVIVAIVGNAAEHSTAVMVAMKDKMNLALTIAMESSLQIALFVAPALVFAGALFPGARPMTLRFSDLEVAAVAISVGAMSLIAQDGESNWFEGVLLLAVYGVLGVAFFFAG